MRDFEEFDMRRGQRFRKVTDLRVSKISKVFDIVNVRDSEEVQDLRFSEKWELPRFMCSTSSGRAEDVNLLEFLQYLKFGLS